MDKSHIDDIDVLLEAALYTRIVEGAFIKESLNAATATPYALGCLLSGEAAFDCTYRASHYSSLQIFQGDFPADRLQKIWIQEEISSALLYNKEETESEELFTKIHFIDAESRYGLRLSFKDPDELLDMDFSQSHFTA